MRRDALKARNNLFAEGAMGLAASLARPLLCLFDRNFDLGAALQHVWTYKPLVRFITCVCLCARVCCLGVMCFS